MAWIDGASNAALPVALYLPKAQLLNSVTFHVCVRRALKAHGRMAEHIVWQSPCVHISPYTHALWPHIHATALTAHLLRCAGPTAVSAGEAQQQWVTYLVLWLALLAEQGSAAGGIQDGERVRRLDWLID